MAARQTGARRLRRLRNRRSNGLGAALRGDEVIGLAAPPADAEAFIEFSNAVLRSEGSPRCCSVNALPAERLRMARYCGNVVIQRAISGGMRYIRFIQAAGLTFMKPPSRRSGDEKMHSRREMSMAKDQKER